MYGTKVFWFENAFQRACWMSYLAEQLPCNWIHVVSLPILQFAQDFAWVQSVYDLSFLHHGSVIRRPRLPITTHFADRLAYMLASVGDDGADWDRTVAAAEKLNITERAKWDVPRFLGHRLLFFHHRYWW